jgi:hypothetical protein
MAFAALVMIGARLGMLGAGIVSGFIAAIVVTGIAGRFAKIEAV